eukprot:TRINITY_DN16115_c0_g1_i1.p1 TRINITY_DN16115_c0_g1~~TRINITY_DN16115_c0_g1_i1.p1  ORF type:complete len:445 (+),score=101.99 TRINITY_DN16115_c0_g1_i1:44-1378(+)
MDPIDQELWDAVCDTSSESARTAILQVERDLVAFMKEKKKKRLQLPPMSAYLRKMIHHLCDRFKLQHSSSGGGSQRAVIILKTPNCKIPTPLLSTFDASASAPDYVRSSETQKKHTTKEATTSTHPASKDSSEKISLKTAPSQTPQQKPSEQKKDSSPEQSAVEAQEESWESQWNDELPSKLEAALTAQSLSDQNRTSSQAVSINSKAEIVHSDRFDQKAEPPSDGIIRKGRGFTNSRFKSRAFGSEDDPFGSEDEKQPDESTKPPYETNPAPTTSRASLDHVLELCNLSDDVAPEDFQEWLGSHYTGQSAIRRISDDVVLITFANAYKAQQALAHLQSIESGMFSVRQASNLLKPSTKFNRMAIAEAEVVNLPRPQHSDATARRFIGAVLNEPALISRKTAADKELEHSRQQRKEERTKSKIELEAFWGQPTQSDQVAESWDD